MAYYIVARGLSEREDGIWYDRSLLPTTPPAGLRGNPTLSKVQLAPTGVFETRDDGERAEVYRPPKQPR